MNAAHAARWERRPQARAVTDTDTVTDTEPVLTGDADGRAGASHEAVLDA